MSEGKKEILKFIKAYHSLPALWDTRCEEYRDRNIKEEQYAILLKCYRKQHPEGSLQDLKKRINVLRTNFFRELKRKNNLEKSGASDLFSTTLYYFNAISFLKDARTPNASISKLKLEEPPSPKKQKRNPVDELCLLAAKRLKEPQDSNHHLAKLWAEKLSKMNSTQKIFAEKVINDVLLHGQLELLTFNTNLTHTRTLKNNRHTPSPVSRSPSVAYINNSSRDASYSPIQKFETYPVQHMPTTIVYNQNEHTLLEYPVHDSENSLEET